VGTHLVGLIRLVSHIPSSPVNPASIGTDALLVKNASNMCHGNVLVPPLWLCLLLGMPHLRLGLQS